MFTDLRYMIRKISDYLFFFHILNQYPHQYNAIHTTPSPGGTQICRQQHTEADHILNQYPHLYTAIHTNPLPWGGNPDL